MIQIQGTSKLLSYGIERNTNRWKEKVEAKLKTFSKRNNKI